MILEQYYLGCLSQASYLVGDEAAGVAAVIDPRRDIDVYLKEASNRGVEIRHVLLTHFHADFASGHLELAAKTGATIHLGAAAETEYASEGLADGAEITLGAVKLRALATPGHTPESTCFLAFEGDADTPHAVFTGDTLFIGDVGRPDLMSSIGITAEELAGKLYKSLHEKLLPLPDETLVYPGHGAGSACGKNLSTDTWSTMGTQRSLNYALQPMEEAEFVAMVSAGQPPAPAYFSYDATLNRKNHGTLEEALARAATVLDPSSLRRAISEDGAQVLDARGPETFASGHLAGSFNVGIDGRFASWAGAVLDPERPIVVIADAGREAEVAMRLGRVGFDNVVGYLDGGSFGLDGELARFGRIDPPDLQAELSGETPPLVLDIRGPGEVAGGAIAGSLPVPLPELQKRLNEVPRDRSLVVQCAGGYRSAIAASVLLHAGFEQVRDLRGGMGAWRAAEMPVEGDEASCSAS